MNLILKYNFVILVLLGFLLTSCASTRMMQQQNYYDRALKELVKADMDIEEKVDQTALILNQVMQESMDYVSNKKTTKHINTFTKRNRNTLNAILDQVEDHMRTLGPLQQLAFTARIIRKPYMKNFVELVPKVEKKINRKIRQLQFFGRFVRILTPDLF